MRSATLVLAALPLGLVHASSTSQVTTTSAATTALNRTTEAQEALITDAGTECTYYSYAPVSDIIGSYPAIWETADVSFSGASSYDKALFAAMSSFIPDIAPRGTRGGDFSNVTYTSNDPDCWWSWQMCTTPKLAGLDDDITRCDEPNTWGFTLDDGPNCSHNAYYDYLQSIDQKATLFYIGSNVLNWPLEAQRGLADGHEICSHTWSHPYMTSMTNEEAFAELYYSKKVIKDVLGITVRCWRPPYGDVDDRIRWIAKSLDMVTIVWDGDTDDFDWITQGKDVIRKNYQDILDAQTNGTFDTHGTIVLTHEINNGTMVLSEEFLPGIMKQFTGGVMPVAVCMNNTEPYLEGAAYVYPNYAQWASGTRSISLLAPTAVTSDVQLSFGSSSTTTSGASTATATEATTESNVDGKGVTESSDAAATATAGSTEQTTGTTTSSGARRRQGVAWCVALLVGVAMGVSLL